MPCSARDEPLDASLQKANVKVAAEAVAEIARDHRVVLTHGNGPQVGLLALQNEAYTEVTGYPLDVLDAESEGMVGYLLEQELGPPPPPGAARHPAHPGDRRSGRPGLLAPDQVRRPRLRGSRRPLPRPRARAGRWRPTASSGGGSCRPRSPSASSRSTPSGCSSTTASPSPASAAAASRSCPTAAAGCAASRPSSTRTCPPPSSPRSLGADALLLLTDVDAVYTDWGTPSQRPIHDTRPPLLRPLEVPAGSMGPKVDAVCRFVEGGGRDGRHRRAGGRRRPPPRRGRDDRAEPR